MQGTRLQEHMEGLNKLRFESVVKGKHPGFNSLNEVMSLKKGYPLFIAGEPGCGKTEIQLELAINSAEFYNYKHFMYLGESGEEKDVFAELCYKYMKKPYMKMIDEDRENKYAMSEAERVQAESWVNDHFWIMDPESNFTLKMFYEALGDTEVTYGVQFDTGTVDPANDIEDLEYEVKYLNRELKYMRKMCKASDRIDVLVNHVGTTHKILDKDSGRRYKLPALPDEWAGGKMWHRRAFQMMLVYRPPDFICDEYGKPFEKNETHIIIQKSKPKGVGKIGLAKLFWDWKKSRFYEKVNGVDKYASVDQVAESVKQYDKDYRDPTEPVHDINEDDELPF